MFFMNYKVNLPNVNWFSKGNPCCGTFRLNEARGYLHKIIFNYQVQPVEINGEKMLMAICYSALPWKGFSNMEGGYIERFPLTELGIRFCERWIISKLTTYVEPRYKGENRVLLNA